MRWADALFPQWVRRTSVKFDREEFRCMDSVIEKMLVSFGTDAGEGGHCSRRSMFRLPGKLFFRQKKVQAVGQAFIKEEKLGGTIWIIRYNIRGIWRKAL